MLYSELNIPEQLHKAVERMGFVEMTEVQEKACLLYTSRPLPDTAPTHAMSTMFSYS